MHVYLFSPIPYSFLHQRPQKLADQFVALGMRVTFIEPCGLTEYLSGRKKGVPLLIVRSAWYQFLGLMALLIPGMRKKPEPKGKTAGGAGGMEIVPMPIIIPNNRIDSAGMERLNASVYRQALKYSLFRRMEAGEESMAIVQNPIWGEVLERGDFTKITYDCIDEISLFAGRGSVGRVEQYEARLIGMSDAVFVTAEKLEERLKRRTAGLPLVRIPNGVDYYFFQRGASGREMPAGLPAIRHPIVGYVGVLRDWMDYALLEYLATEMPAVSFVMVGPVDFEFRIETVKRMPNVVFPGRRDYGEMPAYINAFDVCIIPFLTGPVSSTTNPVKVFEYFALGKPVVSTPLHELEHFARQGLLRIADGREGFASALKLALAESDQGVRERRREVARKHSWKTLADSMLSAVGKG